MEVYKLQAFGDLNQIVVSQEPEPTLSPRQVLVRQVAIGVEPYDVHFCAGDAGSHALPVIPGSSIAGEIVELGAAVTEFEVGEYVVASRYLKTYGEYVPVNQRELARIPAGMTPAQAVSLAVSGQTAYQMMRQHFQLLPGQTVLIHGGMGNVGQIALQLAINAGANVYTTARAENGVKLKQCYPELNVIDYTTTKLADLGIEFNAVLDTIGGQTLSDSLQVLKAGGKLISLVADPETIRTDITVSHEYLNSNGLDLTALLMMVIDGSLQLPPIEILAMDINNLRQAHELVASGHADRKYVLVDGE